MSWKCKNCGQKLKGTEKFCPECATETIYECVKCTKVMDNGKHKYCPACNTEKTEKRTATLKKVGAGVLGTAVTVGGFALNVVSKGKIGGNKS